VATTFNNRVQDYIGDRPSTIEQIDWLTSMNEWLTASARELFELIPITRLKMISSPIGDVPVVDEDEEVYGFDMTEKRIISVNRDGYPAREVDDSAIAYYKDANSLYCATSRTPVYYVSEGYLKIIPEEEFAEENALTGNVHYVEAPAVDWDSVNIDYFPTEFDSIVVLGAAIKARTRQLVEKRKSLPTSLSLPDAPVAPPSPDFGDDLTISISAPSVPVILASTVDTSGWTAPTYAKPTMVLPSAPSISDLSISVSIPIAPSLSSSSVDTSSLTAPTFTPPVMSVPDWSDTDTWITTEEDSEMLAARVQEIQAKVGEYSAKLQEAQAQFQKENAEYQAELQIAIQDAQLESADDGQLLQKYGAEVQSYSTQVGTEVQQFQQNLAGDLQVWQAERTTDIQKYSADIQNEQAEFNKELQQYQAEIQASIQDAQLESAEEAQKIQLYSGELNNYQQDINKEIQDFVNTLNKEAQEYQSKLALYNTQVQLHQVEINSVIQDFVNTTQRFSGEHALMMQELQTLQTQYQQALQILVQGQVKNQQKQQVEE